MSVDYRKILIAYMNNVLEAESVLFLYNEGLTALTLEENIALYEAALEFDLLDETRARFQAVVEHLRKELIRGL